MPIRGLLFLLAWLLPVWPVTAAPFVYVSVSGENRIDAYAVDGASGALTLSASTPLDGSPGALVADPAKKYLFVALRPEGRILNFAIDPKTGALTEHSSTTAKTDPAHLSLDVTGQFLFAAYYPSGEISIHKLDRDRRLPLLGTWMLTASNAHAVVIHPRLNAFLYVPHTSAERIYQFRFNPMTGVLTPCATPYFLTPDRSGPRHMVWHPTLERCYVSNEQGGSVSVYRFELLTGHLTHVETISTLPPDYAQPNATSEIRMRPGGKHLYVANRGHNSIAAFSVEPREGRLSEAGRFPTEANPRSFEIDPSGKFLYAAGEDSGRISVYQIDDATGGLRRFAEYAAGDRPWWVLYVNAPG